MAGDLGDGAEAEGTAERGVSRSRGLPRRIRLACVVCDGALGKKSEGE